jgi:hypothetical protein
MSRTEQMTLDRYADLVRRIVAWVQERQAQGHVTDWGNIAYKFSLTLDEVQDICGDSEVYGPTLMPHAPRPGVKRRGSTTVEVLGAEAPPAGA